MAEGDKIVQEYEVTGLDQSAADFDKLGKAAEDALKKQKQGAEEAATALGKADDEAKKLKDDLDKISKAAPLKGAIGSAEGFSASLGRIQQGFNTLGSAANQFRERAVRVFKVGATAAAGFVAATALISRSVDNAGKTTDDATQKQIAFLNTSNSLEAAERGRAATLRDLGRQLSAGKLTYEQYAEAVDQTNISFREQRREILASAAAEARLAEETKRLQQAQARQDALNSLIDKFGGPLTTSLLSAGRASEQFIRDVQTNLGPGLAAIIDRVTALFQNNRSAIVEALTQIGQALKNFADSGGVEATLNNIGLALKGIASFVTTAVIPAFQALQPVMQGIANLLNSIFGSELTAGSVAIITALGLFTGGFRLLFGVLQIGSGVLGIFINVLGKLPQILLGLSSALPLVATGIRAVIAATGPWGIALAAIVTVIGILYAKGITLTDMFNAVAAVGTAAWNKIKSVWDGAVSFFSGLGQSIASGFNTFWENMKTGFAAIWQFIVDTATTAFNGLVGFIGGIWDTIYATISGVVNRITQYVKTKIQEAIAYVKNLVKELTGLGGSTDGAAAAATGGAVTGGGIQRFSSGGGVRGPGTGTSDSILSWLSNGEFVMRAAAVRQYGTAFMHALNRGKLDLRGILPGFAMGGLVGAPPPIRLAAGGAVTNAPRNVLNLTIGNEMFEGLLAPDDVVGRMVRSSKFKQTKAAGRAPSWKGA